MKMHRGLRRGGIRSGALSDTHSASIVRGAEKMHPDKCLFAALGARGSSEVAQTF
jgi:hypothetical protein